TIMNNGIDTVELSVQSPYFPGGDVFLTEICHWAGASAGEPTGGQPSYLGDDYVELTGAPGSDLSGYTFEKWSTSGSSPDVTHTFPAGTSFSPSGTYLLSTYQGSTSLADYHQVADVTDANSSSADAINIIKDPSGSIVDVVIYGTTSTIPSAAGVSGQWTGSGTDGGSSWGIRLEGADTDDNTNWVKADGSPAVQDPNVVNSGVTVPSAGTITGFTWTHNASTISTNVDHTVGPYTSEGTYEYIATYNSSQCGVLVDTAIVEVVDPKIDTFPFVETFDENIPDGPLGWESYNSSSFHWNLGMNTPSSNTGAEQDHTTGSGYFIYTEASSGTLDDSSMVVTPELDFSGITNPKMNFWYHMHGSDMGNLYIDVYVGSNWISAIDSIVGEQQANQADPWMMKTVDLGMYATADSVRFTAVRGDGLSGDISVDDVAFGTDLSVSLGADTTICEGENIVFDAGFDPDWTYEWFADDMNSAAVATTQSITADSTATYYVKVTGTGGFTGIDSVTLTVEPIPVVSLTTQMGPVYCTSASVDTLIGTPAGGVYSGTGVTANTFDPAIAGPGQHSLHYTYTSTAGCSNSDSIIVQVNPLPVVNAGADADICGGDTVTLTATYNNLFFSEYIEGSSNNKAIELYNGTGKTIHLDNFAVLTNYNGNAWSGEYTFPAGATLNHDDVFVVANSSADSAILSVADETLSYNEKGYMMGYNGDDVRALVQYAPNGDTIILDQIGRYDMVDPGSGWDVAGVTNGTANHTMIRKPSAGPNLGDWDASAGTDSISSEWFVLPQDDYSDIGSHTSTIGTKAYASVSYLWSTGDTTQSITVAPTTSQSYVVTITDAMGCTNTDTVDVIVHDPTATILGPDTIMLSSYGTYQVDSTFVSYNWFTGDTTQSTVVYGDSVGDGNVTISVTITNDFGCSSTIDRDIYVQNDIGIEDINKDEYLTIYPNPTTGMVTVKVDGISEKINLSIFTVNGQLINSEMINADNFSKQYDLSKLAKGVYYIRLMNDEINKTQKLIIQ
ncbi:MAG: lamin tail domain-containing protein, partial [Bacteroidota bacterium]